VPVSSGEPQAAFRNPKKWFAGRDPVSTATLVASASDVALVVEKGIVRDVALAGADLVKEGFDGAWRGKAWIDTVTAESRDKIAELLEGAGDRLGRWRQVNHPAASGLDVPVRYAVIRLAPDGPVLALGRELRSVAVLQQRLVEAHQEMERDYARLREADSRYRHLFQTIAESVLIADPAGLGVVDANPAAAAALGASTSALVGQALPKLFAKAHEKAVERAAAEALSNGEAELRGLSLRSGRIECDLALSAYRDGGGARLVVRVVFEDGVAAPSGPHKALFELLEQLPDGLVVAGSDMRVISANQAVVDMAQLVGHGQIVGERLSRWLGRSATDLNVLATNLKSHGVVRNFKTVFRDRFGGEDDVEVSAVSARIGGDTAYAFSIRGVARRMSSDPAIGDQLPSSVDQLTGLVGHVPLREIVRESTDVIEKLCIEAALEMTGDNRASAAEMLGLSRQGLYSKLKRFEIAE